MGFFDRLPPVPEPEPEPPAPSRPVWSKPEAALGAAVADELLLVRTSEAAVAVTEILAYPTGFEFTVTAVLRRERRRRIFDPALQHGMGRYPHEPLPDEFLRLGLQFSDGRTVTNLDRRGFPSLDAVPDGPVLLPQAGNGGTRRYDLRFWVWPLPPPGPVTFVCEWPALGIPESRADVDAQLIAAAAARALRLWPEDEALHD